MLIILQLRIKKVEELKKLKYSIILPALFIFLLWIIKAFEYANQVDYYQYGVFPRTTKGLIGIVLSPLIHSDLNHLLSNSIPLFILCTGLIYFYRNIAYRVIGFVWFLSGVCVWIAARDSYHIGASGLIYGIASFLFLSGVIRKDIRLASVSLLVVFLYGGLVWGIFPIFPHISWEYHLFGAISGFIAAFIYRNKGPKAIEWSWETEDEEIDEKVNVEDSPNDFDNKI